MPSVSELPRALIDRLPMVQLAVLERPRSRRDLYYRLLIVLAVAAAAVGPVFIGRSGGDATEGASEIYMMQLAKLEQLEQELEQQEQVDGGRIGDLRAQIAELREATRLGHLPREGDGTRIGEPAPDFRLLTLAGEPFRLSDVDGPLILNFWASWCQPCIEEMPDFELVHQEFRGRLTLIGVNDGEDLGTAQEFRDRTGVNYTVLLDPTSQLTKGPYRLIGRPTTYYVAADGLVHDVRVGIHSLEEMRRLAGELLGEGAPQADTIAESEATRLGHLPREGDGTRIGEPAPDFRLLTLAGEPFRLSDVDGPLILNFWASWCQPCIEEMPDFELVHQEFGGRLTLIGVNDGEDLKTAQEFRDRTGVNYTVLLDPATQLTKGPYRLIGRPTTYYVAADGLIHDVRVGIHSLEEMRRLAGELLGEEAPQAGETAELADYAEQALNLIQSGRVNLAVGAGLLDDWEAHPELYTDPGWKRNVLAQTRIWGALLMEVQSLAPPARTAAPHGGMEGALAAVVVAGQQISAALEEQDQSVLATARGALREAVDWFRESADELESAIQAG